MVQTVTLKLYVNTCIPPWKENEPRTRGFLLEDCFSPPFSFLDDSLDWMNPEITEPNLVDNGFMHTIH